MMSNPSKPKKDLKFYTEFLIMAIISLLIGSGWTKFYFKYIGVYLKDRPYLELFTLTGISIFFILLLNNLFSNKEEYEREEYRKRLKTQAIMKCVEMAEST